MITSTVLNLTRERRVRVPIAIQVAYDTDLDRAMAEMVAAGKAHARALPEPAPAVQLKAFADNGIELELGVWIRDPEAGQGNVRSDVSLDIWRRFCATGIEVPFPQREIRIVGSRDDANAAAQRSSHPSASPVDGVAQTRQKS